MEKEKHSIFTKFIAFVLVSILVVTPLYDLIPGLEYFGYTYLTVNMCCLGCP